MSNKLLNLDLYPTDFSFDKYIKIENKKLLNKYQHLSNFKVLEVLMFIFYENKENFIFENYDENLRSKIVEKGEKLTFPEDTLEINKIGTDISYYLNEDYLELWYQYFPEMFCNSYVYTYYLQDATLENEILIRGAIHNKNYENIIYLLKKHEFTFWDNLNDINFTFDNDKSYEIFELDNIYNYSEELIISLYEYKT